MTAHILTRSLDRSAAAFLAVVAAIGILVPLSNLLLPESSPLQVPTYLMALWGKYLCYAILALSIDLIWGYCGTFSLVPRRVLRARRLRMGMYLMRQIGPRASTAIGAAGLHVYLNYDKHCRVLHGFDMFCSPR